MKIIADLHIHSKYSRATSPNMDISTISKWAKYKGINLMGTGDFTHPLWLEELKKHFRPVSHGIYEYEKVYFILSAEVNNIYNRDNRTRRIHNIIIAPSFEVVEKINKKFSQYGNLFVDGRPILKLDSQDMLKFLLDISDDCLLIPSHAWTPHFSLFGSNSGFDSIEECFGKETKYIYSIETGLSSDPSMNWRLSQLDRITLTSNSDAHSYKNIGREANVFEMDNTGDMYKELFNIIKTKDKRKFLYTIEFFPEEGKYHFDGHRLCGIRMSPKESLSMKNICPKCSQKITVGVLHRVEDLADRKENEKPQNAIDYINLIQLEEIISDALGLTKGSAIVEKEYIRLVHQVSEFDILMDMTEKELYKLASPKIIEGILKMRQAKVDIQPGYDGEYGKIKIIWKEHKITSEVTAEKIPEQLDLF